MNYYKHLNKEYSTVQLQLHTRVIPHAWWTRVSAWTEKFTRLQNTLDSYTSPSHTCAIYF